MLSGSLRPESLGIGNCDCHRSDLMRSKRVGLGEATATWDKRVAARGELERLQCTSGAVSDAHRDLRRDPFFFREGASVWNLHLSALREFADRVREDVMLKGVTRRNETAGFLRWDRIERLGRKGLPTCAAKSKRIPNHRVRAV